MSVRLLVVWWEGAFVGHLMQDADGDIAFTYAPAWLNSGRARPLSRSLPLRPEPFDRRECRPFFSGLLPEADQRTGAAGALGVSPANDFALLDRLGGDVAGALMLLPEGEAPPTPARQAPSEPLSSDALAAILDALPRQPLMAGQAGLRLSLAGAQAKLPVVLVNGDPALPTPGAATTHIIKPEIVRFGGSVANEAWCMTLAAKVGLDVARAEARTVNGHPYLLVTRYDRSRAPDGHVLRVHQEDACQALGVAPERKYAAEGGPGFGDLFALTRAYVRRPAMDVLKLVDTAIFNLIIGNADAHGKNFSFLLDDAGPRLAPLYDLLSTIHWPALSSRLAMRIGQCGTLEDLAVANWARFAERIGVTFPLLRKRVRALGMAIDDAAPTIIIEGHEAVSAAIASRTQLRARLAQQSLV
jgi:serine/threonine-protein kinase HipA